MSETAKLVILAAIASLPAHALAGDYRVERIASGLNQSNYVTQAPGDPANILYLVERVQPPTDGSYGIENFNKVNHMGKVSRYDTLTGTKTTVIDFYDTKVFNDDGLQSVAFSPDFQTTGKIYVTSSAYSGPQNFGSNGSTGGQPVPNSRVQEYTVNVANPAAATTTMTRTVLDYTNSVGNNHTIDWAGFDPTATGAARNYLYVSTGDGSYGNAYNGGSLTNGRPSQNPASVRGKMLRLDVSGADAYPTDALRNYAIPASNPLPAYNAAHPTAQISGLGEVYLTGLRNSYRASFDRATGDLYMGDVGENSYEEINFLKTGSNTGANGGPVDFGWPQSEGVNPSGISGAPTTGVNPFTGVTATKPIHAYTHNGGSAVIGGYVYRGPIAELQGKYFFADFVPGKLSTLDFNPATLPGAFNGANGTATDVSALLNGLVFDRNDPNYTAAGAGPQFGLDRVVSFGEDNSGNLYIVDFGGVNTDSAFASTTGQYPGNAQGEVFRLVLNGDFDRNNLRNAADLNALLHSGSGGVNAVRSRLFDLNNDNSVIATADTAGSDLDYLVRTLLHTEYGDSNLDRAVNFDDLLALAQNYGTSGPTVGWANGDFNGDFAVSFDDLLTLAQHYGSTGSFVEPSLADANFSADWALAKSLVPEPGSLALLALAAVCRRAPRAQPTSAAL